MARQNLTAEFKTFVKGIVTEVSPLTFPDNASLDEENFILNRDGTRDRRLGLDFETTFQKHTVPTTAANTYYNAYRWVDGKGVGQGDVIAVQTGKWLRLFDGTFATLSDHLLEEFDLTLDTAGAFQGVNRVSFTRIGSSLVIASGGSEITTFKYVDGVLERKGYKLKIRDFFGLPDIDTDGTDMASGIGLQRRPTTLTSAHLYNLRNQSWSQKNISKSTGATADPIASWKGIYAEYPANSDIVTRALYADTEDSSNRTVDRFWETNLHDTDYGSGEPARGSFIIDFMKRSASRLEEAALLKAEKGLSYTVSEVPYEEEAASAKSIASYSGRVFYSGFQGADTTNEKAPATESFILFTQLISSGDEFGNCYQEGDPTSVTDSDLLATDGGYVQLEDAYNIHSLIVTSSGLLAVAANGVWLVAGGSGYSFSADNYIVKRITDKGAVNPGSVIKVDDTIIYWSEEGIFQVAVNAYGDLGATNISKNTIQSLYDAIPYENKETCYGIYDQYESKVRWCYGDAMGTSGKVTELILDTFIGSIYKYSYEVYQNHSVICPIPTSPYTITDAIEVVTVGGEAVTADGDFVFTTNVVRDTGIRGIRYLVAERIDEDSVEVTLATFSNQSFLDWERVDNEGVDAKAYLLTGYFSGGDILRKKQVPNIFMYMKKTETGFEEEAATGDWLPVNPSSCLVSSQWDWTDNAVAGKWSTPFQAYRRNRHYLPSSLEDEFDNGEPLLITKSRLRGRGRVVSLLIETEDEKDLQLVGWAMSVGLDGST